MTDSQRLFQEALSSKIVALATAKESLLENDVMAIASIHRLTESLLNARPVVEPQIIDAANDVLNSSDDTIIEKIDVLLETLREYVAGGEEDKLKILVIEDDLIAQKMLVRELSTETREVIAVDTAAKAEEILETDYISLIILDLILPDTDGRNFLAKIRQRSRLVGMPVIIVSGQTNKRTKSECFALGADEFFEKPIDMEILSAAVAAKIERAGKMARASRTDVLTGLPNRVALTEGFMRSQALANRTRKQLSIAFIDIDNFKNANDNHGHQFGDDVLRRLSQILRDSLRGTDMVARWGGEEFVAILPNSDLEGAHSAVIKALEAFRSELFRPDGTDEIHFTFSAGVCEVEADWSVEEAVAHADSLMYFAKENGRNQVATPIDLDQGKVKKVLLAEDDELVAALVKHRLTRDGFEVVHFPDGISALMAAPELNVSLVMLDVKMPGLDGFELLTKLRQMPSYKKTPIVMLTSMGREQDIVRGFKLGADDYIMKPFSPTELLARIHRLIK